MEQNSKNDLIRWSFDPKRPVPCRFCWNYEAPDIVPLKKRLVHLICRRCGNPMRVQYVPRKKKKEEPNAHYD